MKVTMIEVDSAKRIFRLHRATMAGEVKFRMKLSQGGMLRYLVAPPMKSVITLSCQPCACTAQDHA